MTAILLLSAVDMVTVLPDFAQWEVSPEQGKCINEKKQLDYSFQLIEFIPFFVLIFIKLVLGP